MYIQSLENLGCNFFTLKKSVEKLVSYFMKQVFKEVFLKWRDFQEVDVCILGASLICGILDNRYLWYLRVLHTTVISVEHRPFHIRNFSNYFMIIVVFSQLYHLKSATLEIAYDMKNRFLVMYSLMSPQTIECKNNSYVHSNNNLI